MTKAEVNREKTIADACNAIARLEKENADLKEEVNKTAFARGNLEEENAELKDYNKKLLQSDIDKQNKIVLLSKKVNDLQKENAELQKWKDEWQEQVQKATDEGYARTLQTMQLNKAKEIIKSFITLLTKSRTALDTKTCLTKAEQFLSEVEK